jgi:hypothetical protein
VPFTDLNDACKGLLVTTAQVLNASGLRYAVAGGWVPLLTEPHHPTLEHPGTRDVDVLMMDEPAAVQAAAKALLAARFRPSAKHEFQLLRDAAVGDLAFVFNVDLMHPYEGDSTPATYNDIFDLGVNDAYDPRGSRHAKSIAFRSAAIVYEQNLFTAVEVTAPDLEGAPCVVQVPLLSPAAAILSKCESVAIKKRTRDAFDIHYMLSGTNGPKAAAELRQLAADFPQVDEQLQLLRTFLVAHPDTYDRNVSNHARREITTAAAATLEALFPG